MRSVKELDAFFLLFNFYTMQGKVKFFNETKGFGFIYTRKIQAQTFFVHASGLVDQIRENDQVEYDEEKGKKGMNAVNVTLVN